MDAQLRGAFTLASSRLHFRGSRPAPQAVSRVHVNSCEFAFRSYAPKRTGRSQGRFNAQRAIIDFKFANVFKASEFSDSENELSCKTLANRWKSSEKASYSNGQPALKLANKNNRLSARESWLVSIKLTKKAPRTAGIRFSRSKASSGRTAIEEFAIIKF